MNSSRKNPFILLDIPPGLQDREELKRLARRKRKELLAEFDLHNLPSLRIHGESWLKSEVLKELDPLIEQEDHAFFTIIRLGWSDFWAGGEEIPASLFTLSSLSLEELEQIQPQLGDLLLTKVIDAISKGKIEHILSLLALSEQLTPGRQGPIDRTVNQFLNEEAASWTMRIMMPPTALRKSEIRKWFPMKWEQLICQLPSRFSRSSAFLAKERLRVSDYVAGKFSRRKRKILFPTHRSNPAWEEGFRERWDHYRESVVTLPREKISNIELSPLTAIGIGISVFASLFISGILIDDKPRPIRPFDSTSLLDSISYEPSFDWTFIDTSELISFPNKDSFFSELAPPPALPETPPVVWSNPLDSVTLERLEQLQELIDSFRFVSDSLSRRENLDTVLSTTDTLLLPDSLLGSDSTFQSTP